jgi:hypothetical protein
VEGGKKEYNGRPADSTLGVAVNEFEEVVANLE